MSKNIPIPKLPNQKSAAATNVKLRCVAPPFVAEKNPDQRVPPLRYASATHNHKLVCERYTTTWFVCDFYGFLRGAARAEVFLAVVFFFGKSFFTRDAARGFE